MAERAQMAPALFIKIRAGVDGAPVVFIDQPLQLHLLGVWVGRGLGNGHFTHMFLVGVDASLVKLIGGLLWVVDLGGSEGNASLLKDLLGGPHGGLHRGHAHVEGKLDEDLHHLVGGHSQVQAPLYVSPEQGKLAQGHQRRYGGDAPVADVQLRPNPDRPKERFVDDPFQVRSQLVDARQREVAGVSAGHG